MHDLDGCWSQSMGRVGLHYMVRMADDRKFNKFSATHHHISSKGLKVFAFNLVNCGRHICCVKKFSVFQSFFVWRSHLPNRPRSQAHKEKKDRSVLVKLPSCKGKYMERINFTFVCFVCFCSAWFGEDRCE